MQVLIIEDDPFILDSLKDLLQEEGYQVGMAKNGQEGLELLQKGFHLPKLILLDLMMPVMDGAQFRTEQMKDTRLRQIPVILMTADGHIDAKRLSLAVDDCLRKPTDLDFLLEKVKQYLTPSLLAP